MSAFETSVLVAGTALLAVSGVAIAWRELRPGAEAAYVQTWRDVLGLLVTLSGVGALLAWLWLSR